MIAILENELIATVITGRYHFFKRLDAIADQDVILFFNINQNTFTDTCILYIKLSFISFVSKVTVIAVR